MDDRTVHATLPDGAEVVRYSRAGKWYLEPEVGQARRLLTLAEAVELARTPGARMHLRRFGGLAFDAAYRRATGTN